VWARHLCHACGASDKDELVDLARLQAHARKDLWEGQGGSGIHLSGGGGEGGVEQLTKGHAWSVSKGKLTRESTYGVGKRGVGCGNARESRPVRHIPVSLRFGLRTSSDLGSSPRFDVGSALLSMCATPLPIWVLGSAPVLVWALPHFPF
jgi:hypothetical protein